MFAIFERAAHVPRCNCCDFGPDALNETNWEIVNPDTMG
jgi:hypothetical protein